MTQRTTTTLLAAFIATTLVAACADDPVEATTPTTIDVTPASVSLQSLDETVQLTATVKDQNGQAMSGVAVAWASSDPAVGTVDGSGLVTAVANGTLTVTATAWSASGSAAVTVDQVPAEVVVEPATDTLVASGYTRRLSAEVRDAHGNPVAGPEFTWASTDTLVAVVDEEGVVTGVSPGEVDITATSEGLTGRARLTVVAQVPTKVTVSPDTVALFFLGHTSRLAAEVRDQTGGVIWSAVVSWSSGDPLVATVDSTGLVTATGGGTTTVAATAGSATATAVVTVTPFGDRDVLTALYTHTDGGAWKDSQNWLSEEPLGQWYGVEVDDQGRVIRLELADNGLQGEIPPALGALASLERLNLGYNDLSGPIPGELGGLANLRDLILYRNGLSGSIPPELGDLANLSWLDLELNGLYGPIPPELGNLASLRLLDLSRNGLSGSIPPELGNLASLSLLDLSRNGLSSSIPPELGGLARLWNLNLSQNDLSGPIPPEMGGLAGLNVLLLSGNDLSGPIPLELGSLANLWLLDLYDNDLSGAIPPELGTLANLERLNVSGNALSGPIPGELGGLASLEVLDLSGNALSGPIPSSFGQLASLDEMLLARNSQLAGALPTELADLPLQLLMAGETDLCAPSDRAFQDWLATIPKKWVASCGEAMAYLVQAIQSRTHPVPLVAGEAALLRVFITAKRSTSEAIPPVRARFYLGGTERHVAEIPAGTSPIPLEVDEGSLSNSANAEIPGEVVEPGLEMVVEIDPDATIDTALGVPKRIPETGRMAVDVRRMPTLDLTVIPLVLSTADSQLVDAAEGMAEDPEGHTALEYTRILLPVGDLEVTAHEPVVTASYESQGDLMLQIKAVQVLEGGGGHYMGLVPNSVGWARGIAYFSGRLSVTFPYSSLVAVALGINMSLRWAPCGTGKQRNPDPHFPDPDGRIGAWGYDSRGDSLVAPDTPDLMGWCPFPWWISGYHFANALGHRLKDEAASARAPTAAPTTSLLLWGGVDPNGNPFLNPAFVADAPPTMPDSAGDYTVTGSDAAGGELFSLSFTMPEVASEEETGSSFAFTLPVRPDWADALATITLSGPAGSVTLDGATDAPMAILRNPVTGQIRGFLRDLPQETQAAMDTAGRAIEPGLEVLFSRGIPAASEWRR